MNSIILPLVASLVSVGMPAGGYQPAAPPSPGWMDLRHLDRAGPLAAAPADVSALAMSSYPEAYQWEAGAEAATPDQSARQSVVVATDAGTIDLPAIATEDDDDRFDVTSGGGLVGIGFEWRF